MNSSHQPSQSNEYQEPASPLQAQPTDVIERKQPLEASEQHWRREQLIGAIAQRIHESLNLEEILNTTVAEVRQFLQTDRVLIYHYEPDQSEGVVVAESVASGWSSILRMAVINPYAGKSVHPFEQGRINAIEDIYTAGLSQSHIDLLTQFHVKAKLAVPIQQGEKLWGLLVAHQCSGSRQWQYFEIELLRQLATQLAIAIQQAELYQQVQQLNANLERQVQERTDRLQQALNFEAMLKRVTDKVRDSLDESQILQTAVQELAFGLSVNRCDTALYNADQTTATICYEYTTSMPSFEGQLVDMTDLPQVFNQLLQGQCCQFCEIGDNSIWGQGAIVACPIFDDRGVLGDLWLLKDKDDSFNELEIRLVQQVANQCAIAIRQARLYQAVQAQVENLAKLNRLKDDFLSTVSHELRTPMANIKMAIEMLTLTLSRDDSALGQHERVHRYLQILQDECKREINLINNLLDLQRLEAGEQTLALETIHLQTWLLQVIEPFRERFRDRQQTLQLDIAPTLPPLVSNLSSLGRILAELLNNACKYTPPHEQITVTAEARTGVLQLKVINSGAEIPASELPRIFDKFYRIPTTDPWKQGGTGLGLALVQKLTQHLGGTIQVESASNQTCFTVELPIN